MKTKTGFIISLILVGLAIYGEYNIFTQPSTTDAMFWLLTGGTLILGVFAFGINSVSGPTPTWFTPIIIWVFPAIYYVILRTISSLLNHFDLHSNHVNYFEPGGIPSIMLLTCIVCSIIGGKTQQN